MLQQLGGTFLRAKLCATFYPTSNVKLIIKTGKNVSERQAALDANEYHQWKTD